MDMRLCGPLTVKCSKCHSYALINVVNDDAFKCL